MSTPVSLRTLAVLGLLGLLLSGCATQPPASMPTPAQFADAFAYCRAVGNVDAPDARFTGPKVPETIVTGLMRAMKMSPDAPVEPFTRLTVWRCMGGKVVGCSIGANIPCSTKADVGRTASAGMNEFCTANANSDNIPAAVTGRATIYQWRCTNGSPAIVKELTKPDAQGFLAMFWYEVGAQ